VRSKHRADGHSLLLAARQLVQGAIAKTGNAEQVERLFHPLTHHTCRQTQLLHRVGELFFYGVGHETGQRILADHPHHVGQFPRRMGSGISTVDDDPSGESATGEMRHEAIYRAEERRLTDSGLAHHESKLAFDYLHRHCAKDRNDPADISKVYVRNKNGDAIPLAAVVHIEQNSSPSTLYHFNRYKAATISASLAEGKTIGDGIVAMQRIANRVLDESFQTALSGASRDYAESSSNIVFAFVLALLLIYLVLAAQFESFVDPFVIMLTVPLALAGALLSLWLFHQTLNIFSEIGMIMLIGLVTKNGILIVEFTNQKRAMGMTKKAAVIEAASQRLRPILMTFECHGRRKPIPKLGTIPS